LRDRALTLLELIIVILIIGILAAGGFYLYHSNIEKSRSAEALMHIGAISRAENAHKLESGSYVPAADTQEVNARLELELIPKYYDYQVVGVTDDNFIVLARRIGEDLQAYLSAGKIPPGSMLLAADKSGRLSSGYEGYASSSGGDGSGSGSSGGGGGSGSGSSGVGSGGTTTIGGGGGGSSGTGSSSGSGSSTGSTGAATLTQYSGVYNSTIAGALALLKDLGTDLVNSRTIGYFYDLLVAEEIDVVFANFNSYPEDGGLSPTALAQWIPTWWLDFYPDAGVEANTIYLNESLQYTMSEPAIAAVIVHEATHADYNHNQDDWVTYTLENHTGITSDDLDWITDPVTSELWLNDTQDQEYNAFVDEILTWKAIKGNYSDAEEDNITALYDRGPEYLLAAIQDAYPDPPYSPYRQEAR